MTRDEFLELLKEKTRAFIRAHRAENPDTFALKYGSDKSLPIRAVAEQIRCIKKAGIKLPALSRKELIYEKTALEQSSSELTAEFKSTLIRGKRLIDMTGGLGIDVLYFSDNFEEIIYCDQNVLLTEIFEYNLAQTGKRNISIRTGDSLEILGSFPADYFDWIYADPARRNSQQRFIGLQNCSPNVIEHISLMFQKTRNILIKVSPAIEIEEVKKQLPFITDFIVVSVDNECREILLILQKGSAAAQPLVKAVLIDSHTGKHRTFAGQNSVKQISNISPGVLNYFYEPDAAIIKSRLSKQIAVDYSLLFVNKSVDYLTADELHIDFPGRVFSVRKALIYNKKRLKAYLNNNNVVSANIARRDFPDPPDKLRHMLNLKDGGTDYLFFTKDSGGSLIVIHAVKANINNSGGSIDPC